MRRKLFQAGGFVAIAGIGDGVEKAKQQQAAEKPADMGLPRHRLILAGDRYRAQAEQEIDAEPDGDEAGRRGSRNASCNGSAGTR